MELKQCVHALWKWSWLIILAGAIAGEISYWNSSQMPRIYQTATTLQVGQFLESVDPSSGDFQTSQQLAQSYAESVRRRPVLQATLEALQLGWPWEALSGNVYAAALPGTQLIQISVRDTDPQRAKTIADEIARQLVLQSPTAQEEKQQQQRRQFVNQQLESLGTRIEQAERQVAELQSRLDSETSARSIQDIESQIATRQQQINTWQSTYASLLQFFRGSRTNYLSVIEPASVPTQPVSPNPRNGILVAAGIGLLLAAGAALLMEYLDDTIKTREHASQVINLPVLGAISRIRNIKEPTDHLVTLKQPLSPITEAYRVLRTNIQFICLSNPSATLLVTSAISGEGKTTTACNLAVTIAQSGKHVILVDSDLRRRSLHRFFGISDALADENGLTSLLLDASLPLETVLRATPVTGLKILATGPLPPNPAELLGSEPMKKRLAQMKQIAEVIIFDAPPVLPLADSYILGALCDELILVVRAGRTRRGVIRGAQATLSQIGLKIDGIVLNNVKANGDSYYRYQSTAYSRIDSSKLGRGGPVAGVQSSAIAAENASWRT